MPSNVNLFSALESITARPEPFAVYTAAELWTNPHTSARMLAFHLDENADVSSRRADFIDRSVEWISDRFEVGRGTKVVDFGCGPGLYAERLAARGARVTGVDFSLRSIKYAREVAREKSLAIDYVHQNYLEFEATGSFDLVLMIMCDFCALSPAQRRHMLAKFRDVLRPGGSVLLDVYSMNAFHQCEERQTFEVNLMDGFWSPDEYYGFLGTFKYEREGVLLDKYTLIDSTGTRVVYNWLQYFSATALEAEIRGSGFEVEAFYGDVAGRPFDAGGAEFAVVARKRRG